MELEKTIYDLALGEIIFFGSNMGPLASTCRRVPGGWIFTELDKTNKIGSSVFVPFHNEFMEKNNE